MEAPELHKQNPVGKPYVADALCNWDINSQMRRMCVIILGPIVNADFLILVLLGHTTRFPPQGVFPSSKSSFSYAPAHLAEGGHDSGNLFGSLLGVFVAKPLPPTLFQTSDQLGL